MQFNSISNKRMLENIIYPGLRIFDVKKKKAVLMITWAALNFSICFVALSIQDCICLLQKIGLFL